MNIDPSVLSAFAALASALTALLAWFRLAKVERKRGVRELSLVAHRVDAAATDAHELGAKLTMAYDGLFSLAGRSGSGAHALHKGQVTEGEHAVIGMAQSARNLLPTDLGKLCGKELDSDLLELEGQLVGIQRTRRKFETELASVEAQLQAHVSVG